MIGPKLRPQEVSSSVPSHVPAHFQVVDVEEAVKAKVGFYKVKAELKVFLGGLETREGAGLPVSPHYDM